MWLLGNLVPDHNTEPPYKSRYSSFAIDKKLEHHPLRADLKQRVKDKIYHIQHVNATHKRVKKWIDERFWGVSTKYLQQYFLSLTL